MKWEDERYVRLYTRDTVTWKVAPWQAKAVLPLILRKLERDGAMNLGGEGVAGLAAAIELPLEIVEVGVAYWIRKDTIRVEGDTLAMPRFVEAQEAVASNAKRCRDYRDRLSPQSTQNVSGQTQNMSVSTRDDTRQHAATRGDTPSCAVPSLAVPNQAESGSHPVAAAKGGRKKHRHPETQVPSSDAYVDEVDAWAVQWGIDPNHPAFVTFLNHHRLKGTWGRDWLAGWRTWMSREKPAPGPRVNETPGANRRGDGGAPLRLFGGNR